MPLNPDWLASSRDWRSSRRRPARVHSKRSSPSLPTSPSPRPLPRSQRPTKRMMQNTAAAARRTTVLTCYNVICIIDKHCLSWISGARRIFKDRERELVGNDSLRSLHYATNSEEQRHHRGDLAVFSHPRILGSPEFPRRTKCGSLINRCKKQQKQPDPPRGRRIVHLMKAAGAQAPRCGLIGLSLAGRASARIKLTRATRPAIM